MTYISSLQDQGIDGNSKPSIFELVEKWKKKNPQSKVEEIETVEKVNDQEKEVDKIISVAKPNETYAGFEGGEEFKYDIKPGEKYPSYYKREKDSDNEWAPIDFEDDQYFDVGARVFKHFDYDEDAFQTTQNVLSKGGSDKVFDSFKETVGDLDMNQKSLEGFENIDKIYQEKIDVTDDQQDSINIQNDFFVNNGKRDLSVSTDMFANKSDFLIEEKAIPQLQAKFEGTGIKFEEAGLGDFAKVTLPNGKSETFGLRKGKETYDEMNKFIGESQEDYKELENKAISEIAAEQGLEPGVNFNVDENQEAIQAKVRQLKNDELVSSQRVENLTQYIQSLGTDFEGEEAGKYLRETFDFSSAGILKSTMGIAGDILGIDTGQTKITDVFDKTDIQKQIQEYEEIKNSNLTEKGKNIETFLKNGQGLLEDLYATANLLSNADYQTPAQATEGGKQLANVNKQVEGIQGLLEEKYNEFNEELKENPDGALFLDKLKRNYGVAPILVNNMKASTIEMGLGVEELAYQAYDLFSSTDSTNVEGIVQAVAQVTPFEEHRKKAIELTDKYIEEGLKGTVAEAKSIEDVSSFGDFITWGSATTGSLIPQVTAMTMAPYTGLALVTASAGGGKFREYGKEMDASQKAYDDFIASGGDPADAPEVINYSKVQMWGGAMLNMGLEFGMGRLISLPLASGKSVMSPILGRFNALSSNPAIQSGWTKNFSNIIKSGAVHVGDASLEGFEEGFIGIGDQWYNRYVLGKDVSLMDGFYDQFAAGFVGGGYFKAPGIIQSYLSPVQTPGDVSNITGLQNEIKSINNAIIQNPKMSQKTREVLENNVAEKVIDINNSINKSLNIYTELSEADFNELGGLDQQLYNINSQLEAVQEDPGIEVGKEQLIEDLTNKRNELTGQKNQLIEGYVKRDAEGKVTGGRIVAPIIKFQEGADVVAEQLSTGIQRFETDQDFLGGVETLKEQGVNIDLQTNEQGEVLPASEQNYGLIASLEDGTKQIIINNASSQADGLVPADAHELIHMAAAKMDPVKKVEMGKSLLDYVNSSTVTKNDRVQRTLDTYKKDLDQENINEATYYEEVMAVVNDGLLNNEITINEPSGILAVGNKILEAIGWKQNFDDGKNVIKFLQDFNQDIIKGEGLSQEVLDTVESTAQPVADTNVIQSKKLPEATEAYMDLDNSMLQQGLNSAIKNKTDQQFPIAQALVEKNWPLISKSLNINNEAEMNAAKEVVVDQILGQFEGSGQGRYGPRNTSALSGFSLEGGAQVSTYLAETIRTRKPEIDAAIIDRTAGPGIQVDQIGDVVTQTETTEVAETRPLPSETTTYSDAILETVNTDKAGLETRITEAVQESYPGRTDIRLAETRNIPQKVAEVYTEMLGITNPNRLTDKSQTFSVTDEAGLRNAQMFLTQNAQADFANLPDALDADGRGTFIPLNVKRALYTDGKKTGTLKDYLDLIKIPATKKIYRDSAKVGTIRGLLSTHIRNRILETGNPDAASRKQSGAKFSKKAPTPRRKDTRTPNQVLADEGRGPMRMFKDSEGNLVVDSGPVEQLTKTGRTLPKPYKTRRSIKVKEVQNIERKGAEPLQAEVKKGTIVISKTGADFIGKDRASKNRSYIGKLDEVFNKKTKETVEQARDRVANSFLDSFPKWKSFLGRSMQGGLAGGIFLTAPVFDNATKNVPQAVQTNVTQVSISTDSKGKYGSKKLNPKSLKDVGTKEFKNQQLDNIDIYVDYWKDVAEYLQTNKKDAWLFGVQAIDSQDITSGPFRKAAIYGFYNINNKTDKPDFKSIITVEHSKPNKATANSLYDAAQKGPQYVEALRPVVKGSYMQGALKEADDKKVNVDYKSTLPDVYYTDVIRAILDGKLDYLINKYPGIASVIRMSESDVNLNDYKSTFDSKTIPEIFNVAVDPQFRNDPNVIKAQNKAITNTLKGMSKADVKKQFKLDLDVAKAETVATDKSLVKPGPEIFTPEMTVEQMKTVATNSLKTKVLSSKKAPKPKGISIFDFDDTLANTKEKVIVKTPDGKTREISAAEFAREAGNLVEAGAEFDFSNFENVAKDTAEGPLADLARKRQGKFGSGDIFVLTARPAEAAPAIKQFLKSIGINIPLSNITGLSDGSPQAKVDFVLNKTGEGYNDFYFADDSFANVKAVSQILDAVDVKNTVEQAQSKEVKLNNDFNKQLEEVTGKESFKKYSDTRARLEGKKKDGGIIKRFTRQFTITPSADDFMGLLYAMAGKGEQGNNHLKFLRDNLIDPYNKAELELLTAKVNVGKDFAALRSKFPSLKGSTVSLSNPLLKEIDGGPFNKEQAVRVYLWNKQGVEIPGMAKRDINTLVKAVEADIELQSFADQLSKMQRGPEYPPPGNNWLGGSIKSDVLESMDKSFRSDLMSEFNENVDIIFSPENLNKIEAIYGSKYRNAIEDSIRRMKTGSNRPKLSGSGSGLVNEMLDWLNASVANVMFLNMRSGLLQTMSTVNFINWGDNNIVNASKAFASKEMWPTFMRLMNSDYLVNRRDGLKINVNEAELADAAKKGGIKGAFSFLLDKGFAITRVMDSFAIALGGSTFFINRKKALLNRVNENTGKLYTKAEADVKAFEDFYAIAEETQQSSNPSKISSQQASIAGRVLLSFQNVTMQFNRKTKKSIQDLYNRRKKPGMTQRESDMSNLSSVVYYVGMQNLMFNALQQGMFALMFDDEEDEDKKKDEKLARTINGMADSLLFGLGFGGAIVSTSKNILMRIADESDKNKPDYRDIPDDVFDVSSVIDAKYRKLKTAARTFTFNRDEIKRRGWSLDNPAYLAVAQIVSAVTNAPIDRVLQKVNNLRQASDESVRTWQRVALVMGWNGWNFGLPYWGRQSTIDQEAKNEERIKEKFKIDVRKMKSLGFTKRVPFTGPKSGKPKGKLGVDYVAIERYDGLIQYYKKP